VGSQGATSRCLAMTKCDDNTFISCEIGNDTVARTAANASVEFVASTVGCARNKFYNCFFPSYCTGSGTGAFFVKTAAAKTLDRYVLFKDCIFHNAGTQSGGVTQASAFSLSASSGGNVLLINTWTNCASWNTGADTGIIWSGDNSATPATNKGGILQVIVHA
jgi:hypothetical protein